MVARHNANHRDALHCEADHLQSLPRQRSCDYDEATVTVTSSSGFVLRKVFYTVPSTLIGHRLKGRIYDDRLELWLGASPILTLPRGPRARWASIGSMSTSRLAKSSCHQPRRGGTFASVGDLALKLLADMPRIHDEPRIFPVPYPTLRRRFKLLCETAGIVDCRLHDIRRTVATSAAGAGISVLLLRDLLGHKTVAMANRYARRAG